VGGKGGKRGGGRLPLFSFWNGRGGRTFAAEAHDHRPGSDSAAIISKKKKGKGEGRDILHLYPFPGPRGIENKLGRRRLVSLYLQMKRKKKGGEGKDPHIAISSKNSRRRGTFNSFDRSSKGKKSKSTIY